jgi:type III secretory pathway component EscU
MIIFPYSTAYKVAGTLFAFYVGYLIEPKKIKFNPKAVLKIQIFKMLIGLIVLFALKELLKIVFPVSIFSDLIRYFILGLWVTMFAPLLFMRIFRK